MYDVIIAGGGIAGLSAALILGRCRRKVLVCDAGKPRNRASRALHGFISRDGIHPLEIRRLAREELGRYPSVLLIDQEIVDAIELAECYESRLADGSLHRGKYLLLATGVVDKLPDIPGIETYYGKNVFHCPYCDGWEMTGQPLVVIGNGRTGFEFALEFLCWTKDIVLCTDGQGNLGSEQLAELSRWGIGVITDKIIGLEGEAGQEITILFERAGPLSRRALFFNPDQHQASPLAARLECPVTDGGVVEAGRLQQTKKRLFVAGDAAKSIQLAIVAAAEGAEAAFALNTTLQKEMLQAGPE